MTDPSPPTAGQIAELRRLTETSIPDAGTQEQLYFLRTWRKRLLPHLPALLALAERPRNGEVEAMIADYAKAQGQILGSVRWARDALALLRKLSAGESGGWQPIATAPKDGTSILSCRQGAIGQAIVWWGPRDGTQHWIGGAAPDYWTLFPTHWQPLPEPPK